MLVLAFTIIRRRKFESFVIILCALFIGFGAVAEGVFGSYALLRICIVAMLTCYYMFFQSDAYEDTLVKEREEKARLDAVNKAKSEFLARMSHDVRTPINAMLGFNELIAQESGSMEIREYSANIEAAGKHLLGLVNDILDLSKAESGKLSFEEKEYDVEGFVRNLYALIRFRAENKGLKLLFQVEETVPKKLFGDPLRLSQVISNLLTNAVKYTEKGSITLKMTYQEGILTMIVADTGIGIREEDQGRVFSRFEQLDSNAEGVGLGLAIIKELIGSMNGTIKLESEFGRGTSFTVRIPQRAVDASSVGLIDYKVNAAEQDAVVVPENVSVGVLSVDDTRMNRILIEKFLKKTSIQVTSAESGEQALELVRKHHYDLILLDAMMPKLDGVETLKRMRKDEKNLCQNTPVIVVTADAIVGAREKYLSQGFTDYLAKPVTYTDLLKTILKYTNLEPV